MDLVIQIIHVLACILIIGVILLQSGKGGGMGAGFGGASAAATQIFGGRGAGNFLSRSTVGLAAIFMATSLGLAYLSSRPNSLLDLSETSGTEASDEDTIIERGSGDLVELGADATPEATPPTSPDLQNLDLESLLKQSGQQLPEGMKLELNPPSLGEPADGAADAAPQDGAEEAPAPQPKVEAKEEAKPAAPAEPAKPAAKPKPKPARAKAQPKPADNKEEAKPADDSPAEPKPAAKPEATPEPAKPAEAPAEDEAAAPEE